MKADQLLAVLLRSPLDYRIIRQSGSHRRLVSRSRPANPVTFAYHHGTTVDPMAVRDLLVNTVGLDEDEAVELL